ncbi:MAG: glycosyltransferase family A protein [Rhodovibrio sp.]|nr:glycosyltransferase family A protein [Rhodovibrio sp.]
MPKHSIIIWDRAFRNFFHLLPSLAEQDYPLDQIQIVVVEQNSEATAVTFAEREGCAPVGQVIASLPKEINVDVVYLEEDDQPYHPGRLLNEGLARSDGDICSTMDCDVLVPRDFLRILDRLHARGPRVVTMARSEAAFPCGTTIADWKNQIVDYDLVRNICPNAWAPIPRDAPNKAPLLSARRAHWDAIGGYDPHYVFSTAYTKFGMDVSTRFKLLLGQEAEIPHPKRCIHPWHPTEVNRQGDSAKVLFSIQDMLIRWSVTKGAWSLDQRHEVAETLYRKNAKLIDWAVTNAETDQKTATAQRPANPVERSRNRPRLRHLKSACNSPVELR